MVGLKLYIYYISARCLRPFYPEEMSRHSELILPLFAAPFLIEVTFLYSAESDVPGSLLTKLFEENLA